MRHEQVSGRTYEPITEGQQSRRPESKANGDD